MTHNYALHVVLLVALSLAIACSDSSPAGTGGTGGGEPAIDNSGKTLIYVVNTGEPTLSVIDHETREVSTIELGAIAHGQIPSSTGDRLYVCTEDTGEVLAIDTKTHEIPWRVTVVEGKDDQVHQPSLIDDRWLFCPDAFAERTVIVDVENGTFDGFIRMVDETDPNNPIGYDGLHNSYPSGDGRHVYVEGILSSRVAKIDSETRQIVRHYVINGFPRPIAIMSDDSRMFVQSTDVEGFLVIDLDTGEETRRIEFGNEPTESWEETNTILKPKSHGIGLTPDESELWATSTMADEWRVFAIPSLEQRAVISIPEGNAPNWITFTPDGDFAYVSNTTFVPEPPDGFVREGVPGTVTVIDTNTYEVVRTFEVGPLPKRLHAVRVPD
ncbi:MAG: beta-propeller fold lactonase family protein [Myxococcota bacterium]